MPLFSTLGSLYEFKQTIPRPLPPANVTLTRLPGYNLQANYVSVPLPPFYFTETYTGKLNNSTVYTSSSNTTSMDFNRIAPFSNYFATIFTTTISGTSLGNSSSNVYMSSNLTSNGNTTISNASAITTRPNNTEVDIGTSNGYLLRYSRNNTTGQLTLLSNTFIANNAITSLSFSQDGNFLYILANNASKIYNYNLNSNTFVQTGLSNLQPVGSNLDSKIYCSSDGNNIIAFAYTTNPFSGYDYRIQNYTRNANTGNLTLQQSVVVGSNFGPVVYWRPSYNGNGNIVVGANDGSGNAQINLYTANSNTIAFNQRANLFLNSNNTLIMNNIEIAGNTAVVNMGNSLNVYRFSTTFTSLGNTNTGTTGLPFCPLQPENYATNTIILYNGSVTYRRNGNGTISLDSTSASFVANALSQASISYDTKHVYVLNGSTLTIYNVTA